MTDRLLRATAAAALAAAAFGATAASAAEPAAGGAGLLAAADASPATVIGRVGRVEKLDVHGYAADLRVDQVLRGPTKLGDTLRIAWEELSPQRPPRLAEDARVLAALEPVPSHSLWRKRFPDPREHRRVQVIANRGRAFLRDPDGKTVYALQHYLALGPAGGDTAAGLAYLVDLAAVAPEGLALEALHRLAQAPELAVKLPAAIAEKLVAVAGDARRPHEVRMAVLEVAGTRELEAAREVLAELAKEGSSVEAAALLAVGRIDGRLPEATVVRLLKSEQPALRAVATRFMQGDATDERLAKLVREDPAGVVRAKAAERLIARHAQDAFDAVAPALGDDDPAARAAVARVVGMLGSPAVPALRGIVASGSRRAKEGALLALTFAGREGLDALHEIAREHPDEQIRDIAKLALGEAPGHKHEN